MLKKLLRQRQVIYIVILASIGFLIRLYFAPSFIETSGDIRLYADWGEKLFTLKPLSFYQQRQWLYAPPNYPPILSLIYGAAYFIYEKNYLLAQLHNLIRIPPGFLIKFIHDYGYFILLKLPGILSDLGVSLLIYKFILEISKNKRKALLGFAFYLFNPVTIFLSSIWGQTDSLISFLGLASFYYLYKGNFTLSLPLLFTGFYIKPNWGIFIPLFIFVTLMAKPKFVQIFKGGLISLFIFILATAPFSRNIIGFTFWMMTERILPTATVAHKASISAFNLYTIFWRMDSTADSLTLLGTIPLNILGYISFTLVNLITIYYLKRVKINLENISLSLFVIGFGAYLFLTNMLERYFFSAFAPLVVLIFVRPKLILNGVLVNVAVYANLTYAFFRRTREELAETFSANNFLLIRTFSVVNIYSWFFILLSYIKKIRRN